MNNYELLKIDGTWNDRVKYILSLSNKTELESYLKQSSSYDDIQMLIFLSKLTKNEKNLIEIFQTDSFPIKQRIKAGKSWLQLQNNEQQIYDFIINIIDNKNQPRIFKNEFLKFLHHIHCLKNSSTFFYNLACYLTKSSRHDRYNLDAYLVPFCSQEQIINLLSQWSIKQIPSSSLFYRKLIALHPLIFLQLNSTIVDIYSRETNDLFSELAEKDPKAICRLTIDCLNQLEKSQRYLPYFIRSKEKYLFKKCPDEMIDIITIVASDQPGSIKYRTIWDNKAYEDNQFQFPRSFSLQHYVRLFSALYDTCQWSCNHTIEIFQCMLPSNDRHLGLSSIRKRRKWLIDIVINQYIGKDFFIEKLLQEGNEKTLELFEEYSEITTPLSLHLISEYELNKTLSVKTRLTLLRYQSMTKEVFDEFLMLLSQTNSNINQREQNYVLFLQCAFATNDQQVSNVLQWIEKRFQNERLSVIEYFLRSLDKFNNRFHLEILPKNFPTMKNILHIACHHLQRTTSTFLTISSYGLLLLQHGEYHSNKQIQSFACEILQECFSIEDSLRIQISSLPLSYPIARHLLADIFISNIYSKYLSKNNLTDLNDSIVLSFEKPWLLPSIDSFLHSFFYDHLPTSKHLQTAFQIDQHSSMISIFLKNRSTQHERVKYLINNIDPSFFFDQTVQSIILHSKESREFIDKLVENEQCLTVEKFANKDSQFVFNLEVKTKNMKFPCLHLNVLNNSSRYLTGKQQEHITKIILNDYLQDKEISNLNKLKALRILRRLTHTYPIILQWFEQKQGSIFAVNGNPDTSSYRGTRGANAQSIDDIVLCLPSTLDLSSEDFLKYFHFLKTKLNAANAKYVSDALRILSRRISDPIFLKYYLELIHNEQFQKLGITVNKEVLRLLTEYTSDSSLIISVIKPFWEKRPHQDVRACLVLTLFYFLDQVQTNEEKTILWRIFEDAANDSYLPVIQSLFSITRVIQSSNEIFREFVNRIQLKVLDHPTSIEARVWAWTNISSEVCDSEILFNKAKQLCIRFDKDANSLWEHAFNQIIILTKQQQRSHLSDNIIIDTIKQLISHREIDVDNQLDLPVYHRIQRILDILIQRIYDFNLETKQSFRSLGLIILQIDQTFAPLLGTLFIKIAQNRDDLQSLFILLRENLSKNYFENVLIQLAKILSKSYSSSFIQQLNVNEKLDLAQWFLREKDYELFAFDLLKKKVFNQSGVSREQSQDLIRQMRQSENLFVREQAMRYVVPWKVTKKKNKKQAQEKSKIRTDLNPDNSDIDLCDIFVVSANE